MACSITSQMVGIMLWRHSIAQARAQIVSLSHHVMLISDFRTQSSKIKPKQQHEHTLSKVFTHTKESELYPAR